MSLTLTMMQKVAWRYNEDRRNLATVRSGEYEGLEEKLSDINWKPDFGPAKYTKKTKNTGVTAISARDFLVAYNINLNSTSTRRANAIAFDIREAGRVKREGNPITGKKVIDKNGEPERVLVDDQFPCLFKQPVFTRAHGKELWVLVFEKVWAKVHGTYKRIEFGQDDLTFRDVLGAPAW